MSRPPSRSRTGSPSALRATDGLDRIVHLKTMHLGPDELLVAAKVAVRRDASATEIALAIDEAESSIRAVEPIATVIYLEPDIFRG